jgi:hypothetical protein
VGGRRGPEYGAFNTLIPRAATVGRYEVGSWKYKSLPIEARRLMYQEINASSKETKGKERANGEKGRQALIRNQDSGESDPVSPRKLGISRETLTGADWAPLWVKIIIENQKIRKY